MKATHRWIVLYDICDPKRLRKVAKATETFANRVQYSVFETYGGMKTINQLRSKILPILEPEDSVAFLPICVSDWENSVRIGSASRNHEDPGKDSDLFL